MIANKTVCKIWQSLPFLLRKFIKEVFVTFVAIVFATFVVTIFITDII